MDSGRRGLFALLITLLTSGRAMAAAIDDWMKSPAKPGMGNLATVPVKEWKAQCRKAMTWAITCLRRGGHWDFEGIDWAVASLGFMRNHLMRVHGHTREEVDSMNTNNIVAVHDAHHDGRPYKNYMIPPNPPNGVNNLNHTNLRRTST